MLEHHLGAGRPAVSGGDKTNRNAEKGRDRNVECDAHALHGTAQDHPFAVQLDVAHPLVRHGVARRETDG
jgi:hypothetical protein